MAAQRPDQLISREELLARLAVERRQAPAAPQPPLRVADLLAADLSSRVDCPHPRQLEDLVAGRLPQKRRPALIEHLNACPSCRRYVVGLREACSGPAPQSPPPPTTGLGLSHVVGLALAGMLLLLANSTVLDLLDGLEAPAVSVTRPADRTTVVPEPVAPATVVAAPAVVSESAEAPIAAAAVTPAQEAAAGPVSKVSERESLVESGHGQGDE